MKSFSSNPAAKVGDSLSKDLSSPPNPLDGEKMRWLVDKWTNCLCCMHSSLPRLAQHSRWKWPHFEPDRSRLSNAPDIIACLTLSYIKEIIPQEVIYKNESNQCQNGQQKPKEIFRNAVLLAQTARALALAPGYVVTFSCSEPAVFTRPILPFRVENIDQ